MRKTMTMAALGLAVLTVCVPVNAGGFYLQLGNPEASAEAQSLKAAVTVLATGCHNPAEAKISAQAIGVVKGLRRTIDLTLTPMKVPGMYALSRQWPEEGRWVIVFQGENAGAKTSALAAVGRDGVQRLKAKYIPGAPSKEMVNAMLAASADVTVAKN